MCLVDSQSLHLFTNAITIEVWFKASSFCAGDWTANSIIRKNISPSAENFSLRFRIVDGKPLAEISLGSQVGTLQAPYPTLKGAATHLIGAPTGPSR